MPGQLCTRTCHSDRAIELSRLVGVDSTDRSRLGGPAGLLGRVVPMLTPLLPWKMESCPSGT